MNDDKKLSDIISGHLNNDEAVVLASIVIMEGSAPRGSGTKMVIASGGKNYGTVGGGILEAKVISDSADVLAEKKSKFIEIDLTGTDTSSDGMICGGKTVILLDYLDPRDINRNIFSSMIEYITSGYSFYYITAYVETGDTVGIKGHCLVFKDGNSIGDAIINEKTMLYIRDEMHNVSSTTILTVDDTQYIIDPVRRVKTIYCFGAGHVAVPTAHIATMVGFRVVVLDDRDEFANSERFPDADEVLVINDYNRALEGLDIDNDSFIIIVTRGHRYDREVLEQAIKSDAGYIGMISSKNKRDSVYRTLIEEGVTTAEVLEKVHSPIGLAIAAETPEEIAVSIVGELIYERGNKR